MDENSRIIKPTDDRPCQTLGGKSARFIIGMVLIAASFLVYLAYPIILLLVPTSGQTKVIASVVAWATSWAVFSFGVFLTGPEGYLRVKALWRRCKPVLRADN